MLNRLGAPEYNYSVASNFQFACRVDFHPDNAEILRAIPALPGVFALRGAEARDQPYLTRAADLRRRMTRLLAPPESQSKRLNLRERVATIEYTVTGSEFESHLVLYEAASAIFGHAEARRRLRLHTPFFLRLTMTHAHPRVYSTNRLSKHGLAHTYGPFPSRAAAERYCDAALDLYKLRRCHEELEVSPDHPGCAYGEMKKCMAPCNESCSAEQYRAEAEAVEAFFGTHGESLLASIAAARDEASAKMEFEAAAAAHEQYQRVKAAAALADELVRPVMQLRAVIVQEAVALAGADGREHRDTQDAAIFLLQGGRIVGPQRASTLGVRAVKEQTSVGSSLFAQPLMLQAVPLGDMGEVTLSPAESPEVRAEAVLKALETMATSAPVDLGEMSDHLSLLRRWYYRPEKQRKGEVFLPNADGSWPVRRILRGAARMALGEPKVMAETNREGAAAMKVKILHEGREGVERTVPMLGKSRRRSKEPATPAQD